MDLESSPKIPVVMLSSGHAVPVVALGTFDSKFEMQRVKEAVIEAIKAGYRHIDTGYVYRSEGPVGEAIAEAVQLGLIGSRKELFITTKLWCTDNHPERVLPAIKSSLKNLKLDYVDLYLMHWPMSLKPGTVSFPIKHDDIVPLDLGGVWEAMEECQRLGLTKSIGVSNFTTGKLEELLPLTKIPPAVNQVEMNAGWQQQKLRSYCADKGILVTAYYPLGGQVTSADKNPVLNCEVLKEIAGAKGKTVAQIALRWILEQDAGIVVKSFNKERLRQNLEIFNWELSKEELLKISSIPQKKADRPKFILSKEGSMVNIDDIIGT